MGVAVVVAGIQNLLITGAGGFIGRSLCPMLEQSGFYVRRAVRHPLGGNAVHIHDIATQTDWRAALEGMDAVVHLAARVHVLREQAEEPRALFRQVNVDATRRIAQQAAEAGVRRFVFISTIGVHGVRTEGRGFTETDAPHPRNEYARSKLEAEYALREVARETELEVVILRPPLVYGSGVKANFLRLLHAVHRGVPLPLAGIRNRRDMVYVGNLADAIRASLSHPEAAGATFLVADGEAVSTPELIRHLARCMGKNPRLFPLPESLLRLCGALTGKSDSVHRLVSSLEVDASHLRRTLDWQPPYALHDGLMATAEWFLEARHTTSFSIR
jgi:nucleoside-diphosphate-sugar epimerase